MPEPSHRCQNARRRRAYLTLSHVSRIPRYRELQVSEIMITNIGMREPGERIEGELIGYVEVRVMLAGKGESGKMTGNLWKETRGLVQG